MFEKDIDAIRHQETHSICVFCKTVFPLMGKNQKYSTTLAQKFAWVLHLQDCANRHQQRLPTKEEMNRTVGTQPCELLEGCPTIVTGKKAMYLHYQEHEVCACGHIFPSMSKNQPISAEGTRLRAEHAQTCKQYALKETPTKRPAPSDSSAHSAKRPAKGKGPASATTNLNTPEAPASQPASTSAATSFLLQMYDIGIIPEEVDDGFNTDDEEDGRNEVEQMAEYALARLAGVPWLPHRPTTDGTADPHTHTVTSSEAVNASILEPTPTPVPTNAGTAPAPTVGRPGTLEGWMATGSATSSGRVTAPPATNTTGAGRFHCGGQHLLRPNTFNNAHGLRTHLTRVHTDQSAPQVSSRTCSCVVSWLIVT